MDQTLGHSASSLVTTLTVLCWAGILVADGAGILSDLRRV